MVRLEGCVPTLTFSLTWTRDLLLQTFAETRMDDG